MNLIISPEVPGDRVTMDQCCPWCGEDHLINMPASLYYKWRTRADLIQNISEAARQQSAAATNISATMNVIQEITTQTSLGASQTAESIGNLAQLAADLRRSVADFKLPT